MISYEKLKHMKELQGIGKNKSEIMREAKLGRREVERWWGKTETDFFLIEKEQVYYLDNYKSFMLDILRISPQVKQTNLYYRLQEVFPDFKTKRWTFYRYVKKLREENGMAQFAKRIYGIRGSVPIGQEAQVDFGQYKMKTMYGTNVKVYFFCMILTYSNFRFVYFQPQPFTTKTAIKAHEYAFQFMGGRTKEILYDLDRVFVSSENVGNIIFVREFEEFVRQAGFSATFCKPYNPSGKARVEILVGFVKQNFLDGRIYCGIDALNADCLKWLDTVGNEKISSTKRYAPRELFKEEQKFLIKVSKLKPEQKVFPITHKNTILYKNNEYELPAGTHFTLDKVWVDESEDTLVIRDADTADILCKHILLKKVNALSKLEQVEGEHVSTMRIAKIFEGNQDFENYMLKLKEQMPRYMNKQSQALNRAMLHYTKEQMLLAFKHCLEVGICNFTEIMAFLVYKYGKETAKRFIVSSRRIAAYVERALQLAEVYRGE